MCFSAYGDGVPSDVLEQETAIGAVDRFLEGQSEVGRGRSGAGRTWGCMPDSSQPLGRHPRPASFPTPPLEVCRSFFCSVWALFFFKKNPPIFHTEAARASRDQHARARSPEPRPALGRRMSSRELKPGVVFGSRKDSSGGGASLDGSGQGDGAAGAGDSVGGSGKPRRRELGNWMERKSSVDSFAVDGAGAGPARRQNGGRGKRGEGDDEDGDRNARQGSGLRLVPMSEEEAQRQREAKEAREVCVGRGGGWDITLIIKDIPVHIPAEAAAASVWAVEGRGASPRSVPHIGVFLFFSLQLRSCPIHVLLPHTTHPPPLTPLPP